MDSKTASSTAYTVMQGLLATARNPAYADLFDADIKAAVQDFLSTSPEGQKRLRQLESPATRAALRLFERLVAPNISLHYALRKKFFFNHVELLVQAGVKQVVNIGAGFDLLAYGLHKKYPDVHFVELDHPSTSREKQLMLDAMGNVAENLSLFAVDLTESSLYASLMQVGTITSNVSTVFICEGVFMYLDPASVTKTFADVQKFDPSATFLFTALAPMESPDNNSTWLLRTYLRMKNEPLDWCIAPSQVAGFLDDMGFKANSVMNDAEAYEAFLGSKPKERLHQGEYMVAAVSQV